MTKSRDTADSINRIDSSAADATAITIDSSENVGIGTTSPTISGTPAVTLQTKGTSSATTGLIASSSLDGASSVNLYSGSSSSDNPAIAFQNNLRFGSATDVGVGGFTERMRISSGNLLIGANDVDPASTGAAANAGVGISGTGFVSVARTGGSAIRAGRIDSDGALIEFFGDGAAVGLIGSRSGDFLYIGDDQDAGLCFRGDLNAILPYNPSTNDNRDNAIDLGFSSVRFDDIFATNGTIQTSDQNEKQQIASLTDAEITAAKAISKLFKTFKWKDKVTSKGDNARTHSGVIAQEVQTAMTDAGLDATKYAFFCSDTWWETQTEVPAVEAVDAVTETQTDDDGNEVEVVVKEAVEAQDAYTRTDTYDTAEEAPEGATERTRLGIRYPELLAFVGAATEQRLTSIEARLTALEG